MRQKEKTALTLLTKKIKFLKCKTAIKKIAFRMAAVFERFNSGAIEVFVMNAIFERASVTVGPYY